MKEKNKTKLSWQEQWDKHKNYHNPYLTVTTQLDITNFFHFIEDYNKPFFVSFLYCATRVANEIPAFRRRVIGDQLTEYEKLDAIIPFSEEKWFQADYITNLFRFVEYTLANAELAKEEGVLKEPKPNVLRASSVAISNFTGVSLPVEMTNETISHVVWGNPLKKEKQVMLSLAVQVHCGVASELQVSEYIEKLQELISHPEYYIKPLAKDGSQEDENAYDTRIIRTSSLNQRMRSEYPYEVR